MGQYYKIVNPVKRQYLNPSNFGDSLKLQGFGNAGYGTMFALSILLASGNGRGGGDINSSSPLIGSWAGDPIYVVGDYSDVVVDIPGVENPKGHNLYNMLYVKKFKFKDISDKLIKVIAQANPSHPLAVIANNLNNNVDMSLRQKPITFGTSAAFIEPEERNILSLTDLMKVVDANFGESDGITGDNLIWGLQCLYGFFHTYDSAFKNTNGACMVMKEFKKETAIFDIMQFGWTNPEIRKLYDSIGGNVVGKEYVKALNMKIANEKTNLEYDVQLTFPCSLMDLKKILQQVLFDCNVQSEKLCIGGNDGNLQVSKKLIM